MKLIYITIGIALLAAFVGCRKGDDLIPEGQTVIEDNGNGTGTITWSKDMDIVLKGYVFVNEGQTLTIEPGTVVKFETGQGAAASALVVAQGGKIIAEGREDEPIIFTSELDNLDNSLPADTSGLWGGLIVLGFAPVNTNSGEAFIEGIPVTEPRGLFGGIDSADNSGILKYVSIRYAGAILHQENEINSLTLGGVGNGTTIDNVEVINCADDGIEVFGGNVNLSHIISVNAQDDAFDYDLGYKGFVQFLVAIQNDNFGNNLIEGSGVGDNSVSRSNLSKPTFANISCIGNTNEGSAIVLNNQAGGIFVNSIFTQKSRGVTAEYTNGEFDCYAQYKSDNLIIERNLFHEVKSSVDDDIFELIAAGNIPTEAASSWSGYFRVATNIIDNPEFGVGSSAFYLITGIETSGNLYNVSSLNNWFTDAKYKGAFFNSDWSAWAYYQQIIDF